MNDLQVHWLAGGLCPLRHLLATESEGEEQDKSYEGEVRNRRLRDSLAIMALKGTETRIE